MASAKTTGFVPFLVVYGAEDYFLDRERRKALAWKGREVVALEGEGLTDAQVVEACETLSMEDQDRLVLLDHAGEMKGAEALKAYVEARNPTDRRVLLVALVRGEKLPEVWAHVGKHGRVIEHRKLKTWDNNNEVVKWIASEAVQRGARLDEGVAEQLFTLVGADLYQLSNELGKLVRYAQGRKVGMADITAVVSPTFPALPYEVAEAAFARNASKAMNVLSLVYRNMGDDASVPVTVGLMKQAEKYTVARQMLDQKASDEDIATALGMNPWKCRTHFLPNVKRHTLGLLVAHMARLRHLEAQVKGSATAKRTRVELAVLAIAG